MFLISNDSNSPQSTKQQHVTEFLANLCGLKRFHRSALIPVTVHSCLGGRRLLMPVSLGHSEWTGRPGQGRAELGCCFLTNDKAFNEFDAKQELLRFRDFSCRVNFKVSIIAVNRTHVLYYTWTINFQLFVFLDSFFLYTIYIIYSNIPYGTLEALYLGFRSVPPFPFLSPSPSNLYVNIPY